MDSERLFWGEGGEYGPYHAQEDGWPNAGEVMREYRVRMGLNTEEAARRYNAALQQGNRKKKGKQDKSITASWITMMEKENRVPTDITRRRLLADLLNIPYTLFGLATLEQIALRPEMEPQIQQKTAPTVLHHASVDLTRYEQENHLLWQLHRTSSAHTSLHDIDAAISNLEAVEQQTRGRLKEHIQILLHSYYRLGSVVSRDQGAFAISYTYANRAVRVTKDLGNDQILAMSRYTRGYSNLLWGLIGEIDQTGAFKRSPEKIIAAVNDFEQALPYAHTRLKGHILLQLSRAYGSLKRSSTDITLALNLIEQGQNAIGVETFTDPYNLIENFNEGVYSLGRAVTLTAVGRSEKAIDVLDTLEDLDGGKGIGRDQVRRYAWMDILYAQASLGMKEYYEATRRATSAFLVCKDINSV